MKACRIVSPCENGFVDPDAHFCKKASNLVIQYFILI